MSIFDNLDIKSNGKGGFNYVVTKRISYFSKRYGKKVIAKKGEVFDGATGAMDIDSLGWVVHDVLKRDKKWSDGSECTNWQASNVLSDILKSEGRWFRARTWFLSTWIWGVFVK